LLVKPLIGELGEDAGAVGEKPRRATIFTNAGADIKARGRDIDGRAIRTGTDHKAARQFPSQ
jgi:hypothetical protein